MARYPFSRRRFVQVVLGISAATVAGCNDEGASEAVGIGLAAVGTVLVVCPHPVVQVVGCVLILGGTALVVEAKLRSGETRKFEIQLSAEQQRRLQEGAKVRIRDRGGREFEVTPDK